jgi:lipopolysaccharide biosynthesis regulator YciM
MWQVRRQFVRFEQQLPVGDLFRGRRVVSRSLAVHQYAETTLLWSFETV